MILVWGTQGDSPTDAVLGALTKRGEKTLFVDQGRYADIDIELADDALASGTLRIADRRVALTDIRAAFVRPQDFRRTPALRGLAREHPARQHATAVEEALLGWIEIADLLALNRPSDMASNNSKPYQSEIIRGAGFATPATLVTTDPEAARDFWRSRKDVIYKSVSGIRSIVRRLDPARHGDRLADVVHCPTQFQEYIAGVDWRVHVVGQHVFACRVTSKADDYRYAGRDGLSVDLEAATLDDQIAARCVALARRCRLPLAGIDLRETPEGVFYCFEVNPSPGFTYYQGATEHAIDEAIAEVLSSKGGHVA